MLHTFTCGYSIVRGFRSVTVYVFKDGQLIGTHKRTPIKELTREEKKEQTVAFLKDFSLQLSPELR